MTSLVALAVASALWWAYVVMVHQRYWGALLITAMLLTSAVLPKVRSSEVSGEAVATPLAGPPGVGQCVTSIVGRLPDLSAASGLTNPVPYPTATFGRCDGTIVGEVGSVLYGANPPQVLTLYDYQSEAEACADGTTSYTGSIASVVDNTSGPTAIAWDLGLTFRRVPVGPTSVQRLGGQHWSACVVTAQAGQPYRGRLQGALSTGAVPGSLGSCWTSRELAVAEPVSCAVPHPIEVLGTSVVGRPSMSTGDVRRSCFVFAGRVLRSPDPTARGALRIGLIILSSTAHAPQGQYPVACVAMDAQARAFDGTLIGLQRRPLPTA